MYGSPILQSKELTRHEVTLKKKFTDMNSNLSDGFFFATLESSLKACNVKRPAYQGGTFVGNHVHKLLKVLPTPPNLLRLCSLEEEYHNHRRHHLNDVIKEHCSEYSGVQRDAEIVIDDFSRLSRHIRKCHRGYNSSKPMTDEKIDKLG